jgi:hypothetical protein
MESNVIVVHTTEGATVPGYRGGADAPNLTVMPLISKKKVAVYQHFGIDTSSRALVNLSGGVETNTANAVQLEFVGTCDERHAKTWGDMKAGVDYIFWPDAPEWLKKEVGKIFGWLNLVHGIKLQSTVTWKAYNKGQVGGSYGKNNGVRLSGAEWNKYYGILGHQHAPENEHGDPGNIDMRGIIAYAKAWLAEQGGDTSTGGGATKPTPTTPKFEPFPGKTFFTNSKGSPALGKISPIFTAMGKQLVKKGFGKYYAVGPGPKLGQADVNAYEAFQRSLGYTGDAAKWPPGPASWGKLEVPNV